MNTQKIASELRKIASLIVGKRRVAGDPWKWEKWYDQSFDIVKKLLGADSNDDFSIEVDSSNGWFQVTGETPAEGWKVFGNELVEELRKICKYKFKVCYVAAGGCVLECK